MYYHLIGIKEKWDDKYELDLLLSWWEEEFMRNFLSHWWVVVVSFNAFKEEPTDFGNISMSVSFKNQEIQLIMQWDDLSERLYFITFLWLNPTFANYIKNPISELEMFKLIDSTFNKIKLVNEELAHKKNEEELREQKKYEEKAVKDWLKVINHNIDYIEQIIKAWQWIISWSDIIKLENCLNDMKKVRLWTNFNKMTSILLESYELMHKVEPEVLKAYDSQKFIIDKNSTVTNIDVIYENHNYDRISEKALLMPKMLDPKESIFGVLWRVGVYLKLLKRDLIFTFKQSSFNEFFRILMELCEYFVLMWIISVTILWLLAPLFGFQKFSLNLLPAWWRLWLLIYLFNSLDLKKTTMMILWFVILAIIYWYGLSLLLNTFAM